MKMSKSPLDKQRFRNNSALNINPKNEKNTNKKLLVFNLLEGAIKNSTIHQSIKASEKIQEEKRKRELVYFFLKRCIKRLS